MEGFRVLVATDGTPIGEHAVAVARSLARGDHTSLAVVGVETEGLPGMAGQAVVTRTSVPSATLWARGVPGVEIVRQAEQAHADLVILGRHIRPPDLPLRLGPTADVVIRRRRGPSLFVPPTVSQLRRALVALDGTLRGLTMLEAASRYLRRFGAEANSVTVVPDGDPVDPALNDPRVIRVRQALQQFPHLGGAARHRVLRGEPVAGILKLLAELKADLLVVGVRGGGPAGDMGSGHVGRDLLQAAAMAILSIPI